MAVTVRVSSSVARASVEAESDGCELSVMASAARGRKAIERRMVTSGGGTGCALENCRPSYTRSPLRDHRIPVEHGADGRLRLIPRRHDRDRSYPSAIEVAAEEHVWHLSQAPRRTEPEFLSRENVDGTHDPVRREPETEPRSVDLQRRAPLPSVVTW